MENYHLTEEQQFNQEERAINKAIDIRAENKAKAQDQILTLQLQNSILLNALKDFFDAGFNYCSSKQDRTIELFGKDSQPDFNTFHDNYIETNNLL